MADDKKSKEKISDKKQYWRIAGTAWVVMLYCFFAALMGWHGMVGWKAVIFIVFPLTIAAIFTVLGRITKETDDPDSSEQSQESD